MVKFGLKYKLYIDGRDGQQVEIEPPFSMHFSTVRNTASSLNSGTIELYNLSDATRNTIRKDNWDYGQNRKVLLMAGYGDSLSIVLSGNVLFCRSARQGVDFVTSIEVIDAGYAYSAAENNISFNEGQIRELMVKQFITSMSKWGISLGAIGSGYSEKITRGESYTGSPFDAIRSITNNSFFVDNGILHVLNEHEVIEGTLNKLDSDSGLLGTPTLEDKTLKVEMLFEPRLLVGQKLVIDSFSDKNYNGEFKIVAIKHNAMISDTVGGRATTSLELFFGNNLLKLVPKANS